MLTEFQQRLVIHHRAAHNLTGVDNRRAQLTAAGHGAGLIGAHAHDRHVLATR
jgi:hypothetical protein